MNEPAIPAATLILVRESKESAPELLMVERARDMSFAGGALVFPGGRIDEGDMRLGQAIGGDHAAARVAAIRETLEETAVPIGLLPLPTAEAARAIQQKLSADDGLAEVLRSFGIQLHIDSLTPFSRWVPKLHARRRFDTLFFVAPAPPGEWIPNAIERECAGAFWVTAAEVLERDRSGSAKLIFPTRRTLERLALHSSYEAIVADARVHPLKPITPWVEETGGESFITIPEGIGYPVTREKLEGLWRG